MRFYTGQHQHYCGIDLHARTLYLCVLDAEGNVLLHRNLPCDRTRFLQAIEPFRDDLVVASECIFNWYWLADLCAEHEIHDIDRFESVQRFASYARLVKCEKMSAGKRSGSSGSKIGNVHLKWAFSEAAITLLSHFPDSTKLHSRLKRKFGKGKALSILAHKIGRTVYFMLKRNQAFDSVRFLANA